MDAGPPFVDRLRGALDDDDDNMTMPAVDGNQEESESLLVQLSRHWRNERNAPDLLPVQSDLLDDLMSIIEQQATLVNRLRAGNATQQISEEEHFQLMLVQTEIERIKFTIRSYIRTRLHKIEKYAAHILANTDTQTRLSRLELQHATSYADLLASHYRAAALSGLPEVLQGLDDADATLPSMITEPDKSHAVFFRARVDCGRMQLPNGESFDVGKGSIHLVRYQTIEQALLRGDVELI